MTANQLSDRARTILQLIAEGFTFQQILEDFSLEDIQDAAREALEVAGATRSMSIPLDQRVKTSLRTYEVWTEKEDTLLMNMLDQGISMAEISTELQRHPMTIRRRIVKLGLA